MLAELIGALEGVVRPVDSPVDEKRGVIFFTVVDDLEHFVDHEVAEVFAVVPDFLAVAPEVVSIGADPVEEVGVVIDAAAHVAEGRVEALAEGHGFGGVSEVPFADVMGGVSVGFEEFGDGELFGGHARFALGGGHVSGDAGASGEASGHEAGAGGGADAGGSEHLAEADAGGGEAVDVGSEEVVGAVAIGVDRALVIGVDDDDVQGLSRTGICRLTQMRLCREGTGDSDEGEEEFHGVYWVGMQLTTGNVPKPEENKLSLR